ncbi:MAG: hypothetical protein R3E96_00540 [Planctomycetota bacterium]
MDAGDHQVSVERSVLSLAPTVEGAQGTPTYLWTQVSGPAVPLSDATAQQPNLTLSELSLGETADYVFRLTVSDSAGRSAEDTVTVHSHALDGLYYTNYTDQDTLYYWDPISDTRTVAAGFDRVGSEISGLFAGAGERIFFSGYPTSNSVEVLYTIARPGQAPEALTNDPPGTRSIRTFTLSPDKRLAAYWCFASDPAEAGVWVVDPALGTRTRAIDPAVYGDDCDRIEWTPDGNAIVAEMRNASGGYLVCFELATQVLRALTPIADGVNSDGLYAWDLHPVSGALVATYDGDVHLDNELYSVPLDGSAPSKLNGTLAAGGDAGISKFSPDGSKLAYHSSESTGAELELYVVNLDGSGRTRISPVLAASSEVSDDFLWTPDGSRVIFRATALGSSSHNLYSNLPDNSDLVLLSPDLQTSGAIEFPSPERAFTSAGDFLCHQQVAASIALNASVVRPDGSFSNYLDESLPVGSSSSLLSGNVRGSELLFRSLNSTEEFDGIFRCLPDGTAERVDLPYGIQYMLWHMFSAPDGSRMVIARDVDPGTIRHQVVRSDGTAAILMDSDVEASAWVWSTGTRIRTTLRFRSRAPQKRA